jgi:hypothetical protein
VVPPLRGNPDAEFVESAVLRALADAGLIEKQNTNDNRDKDQAEIQDYRPGRKIEAEIKRGNSAVEQDRGNPATWYRRKPAPNSCDE